MLWLWLLKKTYITYVLKLVFVGYVIGTIEWSSNFYWYCWAYCSCSCSYSPLGKVNIDFSFGRPNLLMQARCQLWLAVFSLRNVRYFSGHTKDLTGKVQFVAGETKISDAVDACIKIFTIAVSVNYSFCFFHCFLLL